MKVYKENKITVYTPTFNRGYCLHQLYDSLCRQTIPYESFEWLVVDDGSDDNTENLVSTWISEAPFKITFYKQKNEGKMAKLNFIHDILDSELCMCVDSDDYLIDNAIEDIFNIWNSISEKRDLAGMIGLNIFKNNDIVGSKFPEGLNKIKFKDFKKYKVNGDKRIIFKSEIVNRYPRYPFFKGEKFPAPGYLYMLIDEDYFLWIINSPLSVVEYLPDGLSKNKFKQFRNAPNSFMFYRLEKMRLSLNYWEKFRDAMHYVSSCIFAKQSIFKNNPFIFITILALPFGIMLNLYIRKHHNKGVI